MSDTITPVSTSQSQTQVTAVKSGKNSSQDGQNGVDISSSSVSENSFKDSIQKAYDDSIQQERAAETESGGNDLPLSNNLPDSVADDGRLLSMTDFNSQTGLQSEISAQLSVQNKPVEPVTLENAQSISPDSETNADGKVHAFLYQQAQQIKIEGNVAGDSNVLASPADQHLKIEVSVSNESSLPSSQSRQLLKHEANANGKNSQLISSNTLSTTNTIEKVAIQQLDISQLNKDQIELPGQKGQLLTTAIQQQQMLSSSQTSLLSQTVSAQGELNKDGFPILLNQSVNNFSTMNLQSIPQAEIVETFARPQWSQGMGKQILWMVNQNVSSAEIRLNPAHLGPIEVLIDMSEDQVSVSLSSRHAVVREAMEQALPKLREMLDANGFNLAETDISQHSFARQREQKAAGNNTGLTGDSSDQPVSSEMSERAIKQISASTAMVDYYI